MLGHAIVKVPTDPLRGDSCRLPWQGSASAPLDLERPGLLHLTGIVGRLVAEAGEQFRGYVSPLLWGKLEGLLEDSLSARHRRKLSTVGKGSAT